MTGSLRKRLGRHLRLHPELIPRDSCVIVAFSGGPDSTALLDLLRALSDERGLSLRAAHFDHGLRPESGREGEDAAGVARSLGVPCDVGGPDGPLEPDPSACRRARYEFLRRTAVRRGADRIATGHQADDQAETVLFRLLRGTGLRGLSAIPPLRGSLVRPLLPFRRRELLAYVERRGLSHLRDPSNRARDHARSRIRHELMPALEATWSGDPRERLVELAGTARRIDAALDRTARRVLSVARLHPEEGPDPSAPGAPVRLAREALVRAGPELQARVVRHLARGLNVRMERGGTRSAVEFINDGSSGRRVDVGGGLKLGRDFDTFWMGDPAAWQSDPTPLRIPPDSSGRATVRIGGRDVRVEWTGERPDRAAGRRLPIPRSFRHVALLVRDREPGDRIRLSGGTRRLKEVFIDRRIPASWRARLPVVAEESGEVLWVPGVAVSDRLAAGSRPSAAWITLRMDPRTD